MFPLPPPLLPLAAPPLQVLAGGVRWFAGGRDEQGLTLAYVDTNRHTTTHTHTTFALASFCAEAMQASRGAAMHGGMTRSAAAAACGSAPTVGRASARRSTTAIRYGAQSRKAAPTDGDTPCGVLLLSAPSRLAACVQLPCRGVCRPAAAAASGATRAPRPSLQVAMAENNGRIIWSHPARSWDRGYGTRVYKTTMGAASGVATAKVFDQVSIQEGACCGGCMQPCCRRMCCRR